MGRVGRYQNKDNPNNLPVVPDSHVTVIRAISKINAIYLFYYIKNNQSFLEMVGDGSTNQTELKPLVLKNLLIPLPPIAEQKRIVDKIEKHFSVIDKAEEQLNKKIALNEKIREKVLQMAIQGKLVEQRSDDGTAEELFSQIQEEKLKLISEGRLKKEKPLPEIKEDEIPFEIPKSWKWAKLNDIGNWKSGSTPSRSNKVYFDNGTIPWLKTGDLKDGFVDFISENITELALKKLPLTLHHKNTVLIAMYGATIGKLGILKFPATTNQACCACSCYEGVFFKFLFYFLMSIRKNLIKQAKGGAQPNISKEIVINTLFPLPPIAEQKRIVEG